MELTSRTCGRNQRSGRKGTNARDRHEAPRCIASRSNCINLPIEDREAELKLPQFVEDRLENASHCGSEVVPLVAQYFGKIGFELAGALVDGNAIFQAKGSHLADQPGAMGD